jgi:hypothetical protein
MCSPCNQKKDDNIEWTKGVRTKNS